MWGAGHRIHRGTCSWGDLSIGQFCAPCPKSQKWSHGFWPNKAVLGGSKKIYEQSHNDRHKRGAYDLKRKKKGKGKSGSAQRREQQMMKRACP